LARKEAEKSSFRLSKGCLTRLGALVLSKSKIISKGFNQRKTHPKLKSLEPNYVYLHAETCALFATEIGRGDTLVVVRIKSDGSFSCSKPCEHCLSFIKEYGIKRIVFTDWNGSVKEMRV
jgi:deoxycytidylate deaminase